MHFPGTKAKDQRRIVCDLWCFAVELAFWMNVTYFEEISESQGESSGLLSPDCGQNGNKLSIGASTIEALLPPFLKRGGRGRRTSQLRRRLPTSSCSSHGIQRSWRRWTPEMWITCLRSEIVPIEISPCCGTF